MTISPHLTPNLTVSTALNPALQLLDLEWRTLNRRPVCLRQAGTWEVVPNPASLDEVVRAISRGNGTDAVLRHLVALSSHDDLAARVVLQRMLPGLVRLAVRWKHRAGTWTDAFDELLAAGWLVVRTMGDDARPQLAARLLRAIEYQAFVRTSRRAMVSVHIDMTDMAANESADSLTELADLVRAAQRVLTEHDRRVMQLLLHGRTPPEMAAELGVSVRTVTNHRHEMVRRLQDVALSA